MVRIHLHLEFVLRKVDVAELIAHPDHRHVLHGRLIGLVEVVIRPGGDPSKELFLGYPPAQNLANLVLKVFLLV